MSNIKKVNGKTFELVARTDKGGYSLKLQKEKTWVHFKSKVNEDYVPFANYKPLHLKNLRKGVKLFLIEHWPSFSKNYDASSKYLKKINSQ